jgi:hypothetical protein
MTRYEKTSSNLKEVKAHSGVVIALATEGDEEIKEGADHVLYIPAAPGALADSGDRPVAVIGVSHYRPARLRRGSAAEPGEIRHGRISICR